MTCLRCALRFYLISTASSHVDFQILAAEQRAATPLEELESHGLSLMDGQHQQLVSKLSNAEARASAAENQASALHARYMMFCYCRLLFVCCAHFCDL